uniref:C2H2-type domain-containing protein n=1 Tax=Rhodosorus marinus TaxID=101924 RepID=A0A7S3EBT5_9RHOD|mmetsp:Transcript_23781/g.93567  ORF Transcript_23781/g.93567 Transcript_23781/m.93567 type:complete len:315 (+) Transcript_23781:325-1269(+)
MDFFAVKEEGVMVDDIMENPTPYCWDGAFSNLVEGWQLRSPPAAFADGWTELTSEATEEVELSAMSSISKENLTEVVDFDVSNVGDYESTLLRSRRKDFAVGGRVEPAQTSFPMKAWEDPLTVFSSEDAGDVGRPIETSGMVKPEDVSSPVSTILSESFSSNLETSAQEEAAESSSHEKPRRTQRRKNHPSSRPTAKRLPSTRPKIVACDLCPSRFTARFNLNKHMRIVHENKRAFVCDTCGSAFQQKCHLKMHKLNVHEKTKANKCKICDRAFGWPAALTKHMAAVHNQGQRAPFSASQDASFEGLRHRTSAD